MKLQSQKGNAIILIVSAVLAVLIIAGIWWYYKSQPVAGPAAEPMAGPAAVEPLSGGDTTTAIQSDLNAIDFGADLEKEMDQQLNADINSL